MSDVRPFQVDLKGVVDLLGRHIYSSPRVFIRELLQNGVDAITARRAWCLDQGSEPDPAWGITIYPAADGQEFTLVDEGIGLTREEVADLLATVGRSSKRDILDMARTDYLGQFGIGLLSCFMVSDEIRILTQSVTGSTAVEWIGSGDGTFMVQDYSGEVPVGTQVFLAPRFDSKELLCDVAVLQLAQEYGEFLAVPVDVVRPVEPAAGLSLPPAPAPRLPAGRQNPNLVVHLNAEPVFFQEEPDFPSLTAFARQELGVEPLDIINLTAPGTSTRGKAFVLPYPPPPNARQTTRVYLGGMLLGERMDNLLPDWAFFVRAVVNSTGLTPTASREGLVEDFSLEYTREQLGACVRGWLMDMALHEPHRFGAFLAVHEIAIKQLVLHDEEMAGIFLGWLSVETSVGRMSIDKLVRISPAVRYARTLDEFRQIASLSREDAPLVNGGYVYDADLIELLPSV